MRPILVTSALPYANGHIHIGHLVEYLQTDRGCGRGDPGHRAVYLCRRRHPRLGHHAARSSREAHRGRGHRRDQRGPPAGLRRLPDHLRPLRQHALGREPRVRRGNLARVPRGRPRDEEARHAVLRSGGEDVPRRPLREGQLPRLQVARPVRRQLRQVRLDLRCDRAHESEERPLPHDAVLGEADHYLVSIEHERPWLAEWTQADGRMPARRRTTSPASS